MTILEDHFFRIVPDRLTAISHAMKFRLVKVSETDYLNPAEISSVCQYSNVNKNGGAVDVTMNNGNTFQTSFKTAEEAIKAFAMTE